VEVERVLRILLLHAPGGEGVRLLRPRIERIAHGVHEVAHRLVLAAGPAQEPAVVVVGVGVVRIDAQRALERALGVGVLAQIHLHQAEDVVRRRVTRVGAQRAARFLERHAEVAALEIGGGELGVCARAFARCRDVADDGTGVVAPAGARAAGELARDEQRERERPRNAHEASLARRTVLRVRSRICPASWPQAASISSPRVLRVVVTTPAAFSVSWKRRIVSRGERSKPESGNGLNGIRLILQGTRCAIPISSRAWSSPSFTPRSMTYSKVMKSRGARSR